MRNPDTESNQLTGPVWLVGHLRNDQLRGASLRRRQRRAGAAVMDYGSDIREQRLLIDLADHEAVVTVIGNF